MSALGVHMIDIGCQTPWVLAQISVDDIRRASVFCFFSCVFAMFSAFMSLQNQRQGFVWFFNFSGFSTLLRAIFSIANERLASCWTKMFQRIRNVLQVAGRRCCNVSGTSYKLLDEDVTTYQERLTSCWTKMLQRIRNKLLDEDVTTYLEWLASCWTKMLQRI